MIPGRPIRRAVAMKESCQLAVVDKVIEVCERLGVDGGYPHITDPVRWMTTQDGGWTGGFWVGCLWQAYAATGEPRFREAAERWQAGLLSWLERPDVTFDLGFLFVPSFVLGYRLTGSDEMRRVAVLAADRMLECFDDRLGLFVHAYPERMARWGKECVSSIIDVLSNLALLWWAGAETGRDRYWKAARSQVCRSAELLIRSDGGTFQQVDFDGTTQQLLHQGTRQGRADDSCWARGQAWAIYGLALAYAYTGRYDYAQLVRRVSDYFLARLPADGVPPWDFDAPESVRDSSAAAIACAAWTRFAQLGLDEDGCFSTAARRTQNALLTEYLRPPDADGLIAHGCFHYPAGLGTDVATVWGDYYTLESLSACGTLFGEWNQPCKPGDL